jgi:CheY-like chemotaxis protein
VRSTLKQGSEFFVRLPIVQGEISQLPVVESGLSNVRPLRVLVVDDNVDTVLSFSMLLRASGHEVQTAHDGLAAVQAAINYRPDIVLLDIGLPGLNGYEVAKQIRQHPELKHVVLVALTGYGQDSDRQASGQAGFTHHIVKPARFEELQKILATVAEQVA